MRYLKLLCVSGFLLLLFGGGAVACRGETVAEGTDETTADAAAPTGEDEAGPPRWILTANEAPRGLVRSEPGAAPGHVLFSPFQSTLTYLVDMEGQVVHTWEHERPPGFQYLQDDGSLIRLAQIAEPPNFLAGGVAGYLQKLSWDGELLWEWRLGDEEKMLHHDIEPLPNGNILAIAYELKTPEQAQAAGRRVDLIPEQGIWSEWILEVEPLPPDGARIVWEWHVWDHLIQNHDPEAPDYGEASEHPRRLDINADGGETLVDEAELEQLKALGYVPADATTEDLRSDFLHMNAIEYNPALDQIALSIPEVGEIWILDHSTSSDEAVGSSGGRSGHGGDLLYRWGNPRNYGRGDATDQKLFYQHQILWVPEDQEGAGHLSVFNNGEGRLDGEYSEVLEWAPPLAADGNYALADGEPFGPQEVAWSYTADDRESFFAPFVSGSHRLENGNTFVCSGPQGRFFEVTPEGEIVWEYRNPFHGEAEAWAPEGTDQFFYATFRATKIPPDHPGLVGRALSPLEPQPSAYEPPPPGPPGRGGRRGGE